MGFCLFNNVAIGAKHALDAHGLERVAVIDFDGGGRMPMELTDVDADGVAIGDRVEPTFRRISTADGIHNYFWKARPVRTGSGSEDEVNDG